MRILLIDDDVPVTHLEEICRREFVRAACLRARRASGSINRSKVAALTGLTRPEVARIIDQGLREPSRSLARPVLSRASRVVAGWLTNPRFRLPAGEPAPLPFSGATPSFSGLVGFHAGDVPPRAILGQLERLGMVRVEKRKPDGLELVTLVNVEPRRGPGRRSLMAVQQLIDCLAVAENDRATPKVLRMEIPAGEHARQAVVMQAVTEKAETFLAGIREATPAASSGAAAGAVRIVLAIAPVTPSRNGARTTTNLGKTVRSRRTKHETKTPGPKNRRTSR